MNTQIISDLRNNDEIERTMRHLTRKFCLDKPNVSAVHPFSRFGKGCWRSVERHQPQAYGRKIAGCFTNCASKLQRAPVLAVPASA